MKTKHPFITLLLGVFSIFLYANGNLAANNDYYNTSLNTAPVTYYVSSSTGNDTNSGTSISSPWKSLDRINTATLNPGDQVLFKAGDTFLGQLNVDHSGTEANPIKFGKYGTGEKPIIDGANASGGAYLAAIYVNNQEYIEFDGLHITNDRKIARTGVSDKEGYGILVHNTGDQIMHHFRFNNLHVEGVYAISTDGQAFDDLQSAGIYIKTEVNEVGKEKHIKDVIVENSYFTDTQKFGFWSQHKGGSGNEIMVRNMDFILRNNHFYKTGGSGITPGKTYNVLVEHNIFDYPGSNMDSRMAKRGSGAWFFNCRNVIAQHNISRHARGDGDTYGIHIDMKNKYVIVQYNYSEDSEGGFIEVLGDNEYATYRYNISVNDALRTKKGNTLWVSPYSFSSGNTRSDKVYIYNNSVYLNKNTTGGDMRPGLYFESKNVYVYNNAFFADGTSSMGIKEYVVKTDAGTDVYVDHNLFQGNIKPAFISRDQNAVHGNPLYTIPGSFEADGYKLFEGSPALNAAKSFVEPPFPMAGQGIFKDITANATKDYFGNPVDLTTTTNIGAYNGSGIPQNTSEESYHIDIDHSNQITKTNFSSLLGTANSQLANSGVQFTVSASSQGTRDRANHTDDLLRDFAFADGYSNYISVKIENLPAGKYDVQSWHYDKGYNNNIDIFFREFDNPNSETQKISNHSIADDSAQQYQIIVEDNKVYEIVVKPSSGHSKTRFNGLTLSKIIEIDSFNIDIDHSNQITKTNFSSLLGTANSQLANSGVQFTVSASSQGTRDRANHTDDLLRDFAFADGYNTYISVKIENLPAGKYDVQSWHYDKGYNNNVDIFFREFDNPNSEIQKISNHSIADDSAQQYQITVEDNKVYEIVVKPSSGHSKTRFNGLTLSKSGFIPQQPLIFEAEQAQLSGNTSITNCNTSSNKQHVNSIINGSNNAVTFHNVEITEAGPYTFDLHYFSKIDRYMAIQVNSSTYYFNVPSSGNWCYEGGTPAIFKTFPITLDKGSYTIKIYDIHSLDKIEINKYGASVRQASTSHDIEKDNLAKESKLVVYPSIVSRGEFITLKNVQPSSIVTIFNSSGQLVYQSTNQKNNYQKIPTGKLRSGIYFIKVVDGKQIFNSKIVIQ